MDETEIVVKLEVHEHEINTVKNRMKDLEAQSRAIQEIAISVNRMAVSIENMLEEVNRQGKRVEALEKVPIETTKLIKAAIITALAGSIAGAVVTAILAII